MKMCTVTTCSISSLRGSSRQFNKMMVFSLLLHLLMFVVLVSGKSGKGGIPSVEYIDLKMVQAPVSAPETSAKAPAEPVPEPAIPAPAPSPVQEQQQAVPQAQQAEAAKPEPFQQAGIGLGIVNGHFGSISDGRTLRDDMREYYLGMLSKFNESWIRSRSTEAGARGAAFVVTVSKDGMIVDARLLQSSGDRSYDRMMIKSLMEAGPLSPLPDSYDQAFFSAPLRFVAPLNLMTPFSG